MKTKTFDSVKLMRELRDEISREMEHMTPGERIQFIRDRAASTALGRDLAESTPFAYRRDSVVGEASPES